MMYKYSDDFQRQAIEPSYKEPIPDCGCGFPYGEEVFEVDGQPVCERCFIEWLRDNSTAAELADMLDVRHMKSEDWYGQADFL